jgi:hypothetical protein
MKPVSQLRAHITVLIAAFCSVASFAASTMVEFYNPEYDYFFMSSRQSDAAALDALRGWQRTGLSFRVESEASAGTAPLTRFFFPNVARSGTRGSHFYTLFDADRAALRALNPSNANVSGKPLDEGTDSFAFPVVLGTCSNGMNPIYRAFKGAPRHVDDGNHRFTLDAATYQLMTVGLGWIAEGLALCSSTVDGLDERRVGRFTGSFTGSDTGTFQAVIGRQGQIVGVGFSEAAQHWLSGRGTVQKDGNFALSLQGSTSSGATFTGQVDAVTGVIRGTWSSAAISGVGTWAGNKASSLGGATALAGPYVLTYSGLDAGLIYLHVDLDGAVRGTIKSQSLATSLDLIGTVDTVGRVTAAAREGGVGVSLLILGTGSIAGTLAVGATTIGNATGNRR